MKNTIHYISVAAAFLIFLAIVIPAYFLLAGRLSKYRTLDVTFNDAQGIKKGNEVRMAGVRIGTVDSVKLTPDNKAAVHLNIDDEFRIPQGSGFGINTSILGGTPVLVVTPANNTAQLLPDKAAVTGSDASTLNMTLSDGRDLIASLKKTTDKLATIANDPKIERDLRGTLSNVRRASENLPQLESQISTQVGDLSKNANKLLYTLNRVANNGDKIAQNASKLTTNLDKSAARLSNDLSGTIAENRATLRSLLRNTDESVSGLNGLVLQLKETIADPKIKANLVATTDNLKAITDKLDTTANNVQGLTEDKELVGNLKATVANLRETSASIKNLAARAETIRIPGERRRPNTPVDPNLPPEPPKPKAAPTPFASLSESGLALGGQYDTKTERYRVDTDYTLLSGRDSFYRLGLYDLSEANKLDLQIGQRLGGQSALRYGIIAGKIGTGLDFRVGPLDFRFDAYDLNHTHVNGRIKSRFGENFGILTGVDSIGRGNRAVFGFQIRR